MGKRTASSVAERRGGQFGGAQSIALDRGRVVPALRALATDRKVGGRAQDALEDIDQYLP